MGPGDVQFAITANDKSAINALNRVDNKVKGLSVSTGGSGKGSLVGAFALAGASGAGLAIAFKGFEFGANVIKSATIHAIEYADTIQDASDRMETLSENTQALRSISRRNGSDLGTMEKGVEKVDEFGRKVVSGDAGALANAAKLGITPEQARTQNKIQLMQSISKGSQQLDEASRGKVLSDIFGAKLAPSIKAAADELARLDEIKAQMVARGTMMDDKTLNTLATLKDDFGDFVDYLTVQFAPLIASAIDLIIPAMDRLVQGIVLFKNELTRNWKDTLLTTIISGPVAGMGKLAGKMIKDSNDKNSDFNKDIDNTNAVIEERRSAREKRKKDREESRKVLGGNVNRTPDAPTEVFKSDPLSSPGNTAIGGTAAIDVRFRLLRLNEQVLSTLQQMLEQLKMLNSSGKPFKAMGEFGK